jgi:leader peptidase (prepilin peptidase) / N-methyltransferase
MDYSYYIIFCIAIFSLCFGSFFNVCIYRIPRKLSIVYPQRSFCPSCNTQLSWSDNIPVFSWLRLLGKCKYCKAKISFQYPLVELLTFLAALATYFTYGITITSLIVFMLLSALIVLTFIDFEFKILPNVITYPGMTFGFILGICSEYLKVFDFPLTQGAIDSLLGFLLGAGSFYFIGEIYYLCTKKVGLGFGDVKLLGMTGAILGWHSVLPTIFSGSVLGAIIGLILISCRGGGRYTEIPFGPWLSLGAILYIFRLVPKTWMFGI